MSTNAIDEERLVCENIGLAYWVTNKMFRAGWFGKNEMEDMAQEAMLALMKAARDYDPQRETAFSTMVVVYVKNRLKSIVAKQRRLMRGGGLKTYSIDAYVLGASSKDGTERTNLAKYVQADEDTESEVLDEDTANALARLVLQILRDRNGTWFLQCAAGKTLKAIAEESGVSVQYVSAEMKKSRVKLQAELRRRGLYE